ncbi:thrombospondin type-1 domain-containing protein 4-like [Antechinus flavipes]|uniref:thrombospondin type-1 domain-containing protein 4-like n=1 Tax=Antechinus flavipes TaxID=38775 RepID=UPI002235817F|nr:thrombospondin type-1 domain-containing protein 4-like [Antechinus flavipes]
MEQTRPCLPSTYRMRSYHRPGASFPASERALSYHWAHLREDSGSPYSSHVISAIRNSVPLHRNQDQRAGLQSAATFGDRNDSHLNQGILRGSRQSHSRGREPKSERRSRNRSPIAPGKYGYGKAPYILPLQTDTGQPPQRLRRQRQSAQHQRYRGEAGPHYNHPANPSVQRRHLYQGNHGSQPRLQPLESSIYQPSLSRVQGFPATPSLFHGMEVSTSPGGGSHRPSLRPPHSFSQPHRSTEIMCIGAYRQYKLCNTNQCPENSRSIREVQCASYNNKPFMGRFYEWEPFAEGVTGLYGVKPVAPSRAVRKKGLKKIPSSGTSLSVLYICGFLCEPGGYLVLLGVFAVARAYQPPVLAEYSFGQTEIPGLKGISDDL